uniref:Tail-anchored protein insertion receptor WRB n=1 Tax=Spumella elongata TaxID=89044 RepID=A0A7S3HTN5_9STRA
MKVVPVDIELFVQCALAAFAFEVLRMIIAYVLARPSSKVIQLESDKYDAMAELGKIRSVQLELVKHSKLTRKVIAIEKDIEKLQAQYFPRLLKVRKVFRVLRFVTYIALGVYFGARPVLQINPLILWPLSWFTSLEVISIYPWFVLFVMGGMIRHILRSVLPIVFSSTSFP